tara:strand:+ start:7635 stop:8210 length:576 start_codon:yes stop_codon:yes gene_type:complete
MNKYEVKKNIYKNSGYYDSFWNRNTLFCLSLFSLFLFFCFSFFTLIGKNISSVLFYSTDITYTFFSSLCFSAFVLFSFVFPTKIIYHIGLKKETSYFKNKIDSNNIQKEFLYYFKYFKNEFSLTQIIKLKNKINKKPSFVSFLLLILKNIFFIFNNEFSFSKKEGDNFDFILIKEKILYSVQIDKIEAIKQ